MNILLDSLTIFNFKGCKFLKIESNGQDVKVWGDNGTGKTTIGDCHSWIFAGKNQRNESDFNIKDTTGPIPDGGIEHGGEVVWIADGRKISFKRVYREVYTKKRGSAEDTLTGHTTDYFIDGVPKQEKEYQSEVEKLIPAPYFQILTNPLFFNMYFSNKAGRWQGRREMLFNLFGNISDQEVVDANSELKDFFIILDGKTTDDRKKVIQASNTEINKELIGIPVRIDEAGRSKPDLSSLSLDNLQAQLTTANGNLSAKQAELSQIQNGEEITQQRLNLRQIDLDIKTLQDDFKRQIDQECAGKEQDKTKLSTRSLEWQNEIVRWEQEIRQIESDINRNKNRIFTATADRDVLYRKYDEWTGKEFVWDQPDTCPTCGQALLADGLESAKKKAEEAFNLDKSQKIEQIKADGTNKTTEIKELESANVKLEKQIADIYVKIAGNNALIETQKLDINSIQIQIDCIREKQLESAEFKAKIEERWTASETIQKLDIGTEEAILKVNDEIGKINLTIQSINVDIAKFETLKKADSRIVELKARQKELSAQYSANEKKLFIIETFTRRKCEMLTDNINQHFEFTRWKLFETQVNGGLNEICESEYKGVVNSDLNGGAEINVGLDIINTFSKKLNLSLPVVMDNCQNVTHPINTIGQQIRFIVSEPDLHLRIQYKTREVV